LGVVEEACAAKDGTRNHGEEKHAVYFETAVFPEKNCK
jgi:hypothetical protein